MVRKIKKNKDKDFEKKESYAIDPTVDFGCSMYDAFREKATKVFTCGKVAVCAEIVKNLKPLVYCDSARMDSYEKFTYGVNNVARAAGAVAGVTYAVANHEDIMSRSVEGSQFLDYLIHFPLVAEGVCGWAGNRIAGLIHAKANVSMRDSGIPTLADAVFGERSSADDAKRGIVHDLVAKSEAYLKEVNPDRYQKVMRDVDDTIEYNEDKKAYEDADRDLRKREEKQRNSCEIRMDEVEKLRQEREELEKTKPEKRPGAIKRAIMRMRGNHHRD